METCPIYVKLSYLSDIVSSAYIVSSRVWNILSEKDESKLK